MPPTKNNAIKSFLYYNLFCIEIEMQASLATLSSILTKYTIIPLHIIIHLYMKCDVKNI